MENTRMIKKVRKVNTLVNTVLLEGLYDVERFIRVSDGITLNNTTVINNIVARYENPTVMRFKFTTRELAVKWLENNREDFRRIEEMNKNNNKKLLLLIQY